MNKYLWFFLAGFLVVGGPAYAEKSIETDDHSDHSGHDMEHDDEHHAMDHDDHSGHHMDHDGEHTLGHDDHEIDTPIDHTMHHAEEDHAEHQDHGHGHHHMDDDHIMDHEGGMIMGQNLDKLPSSCTSISETIEITVRAGRKHAKKFPGTAFAFDNQEWRVKPCAKITWHFINEDNIRHQFMVHGLPRYLYGNGMFHLESTGPRKISGTMIVPGADETYLAHCDISQHMEKGMKAQLVVGDGGEDLTSIPGLTPYTLSDTYRAEDLPQVSDESDGDTITKQITDFLNKNSPMPLLTFIGLFIGLVSMPVISRIVTLLRKKDSETTT